MLHALPSVLLIGCSSDRLELMMLRLSDRKNIDDYTVRLIGDRGTTSLFPRDGPASLLVLDCVGARLAHKTSAVFNIYQYMI